MEGTLTTEQNKVVEACFEIAKRISQSPELVSFETSMDPVVPNCLVITLHVPQKEVGIFIGRGGESAQALRRIVDMIAGPLRCRAYVKIAAPPIQGKRIEEAPVPGDILEGL